MAACAAAGLGLWLTRASLDVAPAPGGEMRVAMFPSGVELAALIVLSVVVTLLLGRTLRALLRRRTPRATALPVDPLLPLLSLPWLAAPYLPWLPDAVPALRALSGPARFGLWAVVVGQALWLVVDLMRRTSRPEGGARARSPLAKGTAITASLGLLVFAAAAGALTGGAVYPAGDEPHYLVVTESLVRDRDLRVGDNYEARDYRRYHAGPLAPNVSVRDGVSYAALPVGLPVLVAPAFALGGYRAVTMLLAALAAIVAAFAWRWAAGTTGTAESATTGWLAVAGSAPFLLHSFAVTPDLAAAAVIVAAVAWTPSPLRTGGLLLAAQSLLVGLLPWLAPKYLPLSMALAAIVATRQSTRRDAVLAVLPAIAAIAGALASYAGLRGSVWFPEAGASGPRTFAAGLAAAWVDQESGLLLYAPAAMLAFPGLASMWRAGGAARRRAAEIVAAVTVLLVTTAAAGVWPQAALRPAQHLVAVLPLLVLPIAWWDRSAAAHPVRRAAGRVLVLAGLAISGALVAVNAGVLVLNRRDGSSQLLEWIAPSHDLVRLFPSFAIAGTVPIALALAGLWLAAVALASLLAKRAGAFRPAAASPIALTLALGAGMLVAAAAPAALGPRLAHRIDPAARAESSMLTRFDARRRPAALAYDGWRPLPPSAVPALFTFEGRPGLRRGPQPVRVLLNTRLALPAGDYEVEIRAGRSAGLDGGVSLQVGRTGGPIETWHARADAGDAWHQRFRLDVDTPFVGFRTAPDTERAVDGVLVRPLSVVNTTERLDRHFGLPPVLAASRYGPVTAYFHGAGVYPEAEGFWVRGQTTLLTTFAKTPAADAEAVRLRVHTGAAPNRVHFAAGVWRTTVDLRPGEDAIVEVPLVRGSGQAAVAIVTGPGFVPAETTGGTDRRRLGCWIEVLE